MIGVAHSMDSSCRSTLSQRAHLGNSASRRGTSPSADLEREARCSPIKAYNITPISDASAISTNTPAYHEPSQTVTFIDWDDSLFPTYDLLDRMNCRPLVEGTAIDTLPQEKKQDLCAWQDALFAFLKEVTLQSRKVVILTNAKPGWVQQCIENFAPALKTLFDGSDNAPKVVYAREKLKNRRSRLPRPVVFSSPNEHDSDSTDAALTHAKFLAMQEEVKQFYSQYKDQTWKNILSLGDARYEHDALQEVSFKRVGPENKKERLRTKAIILPSNPTLSEMTHQLIFSRIMFAHYILFDGDIDLDLQTSEDPVREIAAALKMPELLKCQISRHAWGKEVCPAEGDTARNAATLANMVSKSGHLLSKKRLGYM